MSRLLPLVLAASLLASGLACSGGDVTPPKPREFVYDDMYRVPVVFQGMDLPYYGGQIEQSGENSMTVSYTDDDASMDQLKERWPDALATAGWVEESRNESGNGDLGLTYQLPNGRRSLVSISVYRPKVWRVYIGLSDGGTP
ncbi:MAG: hypothetical protein ACJAZO_003257 [Myxococcota bacterium]|jgi:hypothetical protein